MRKASLRTPTSSPVTTCILHFPSTLPVMFFLTGNKKFCCYVEKLCFYLINWYLLMFQELDLFSYLLYEETWSKVSANLSLFSQIILNYLWSTDFMNSVFVAGASWGKSRRVHTAMRRWTSKRWWITRILEFC